MTYQELIMTILDMESQQTIKNLMKQQQY